MTTKYVLLNLKNNFMSKFYWGDDGPESEDELEIEIYPEF